MAKKSPYNLVLDYLCQTIGDSLQGLGKDHEKVKPFEEATLIDYFEKYIYKEMNNYVLIGADDAIYIYNGRYYETHRSNEDMLFNIIKDAMKRMGVGLVYQKNSYSKIGRQVISGMKVEDNAKFKPNRDFIVFNNGVMEFDDNDGSKTFHSDFDMKYQTDVILDIDYVDGATSALWDRIIVQTIPNDEMREAFQMFCGAFLVPRTVYSIEYICYLLGGGRNGKSLVTGAIASVFGKSLVSSFSLQELLFDNDKSYNRACLVGKVANFSDDVTKKDYSGGAYKTFISGHDMKARHPFGKPFDLTEIPYLVCCVNEMPPSTDDTVGNFRRMMLITCPNQISAEQADESLPAKLKEPEVKTAIMNWILEGREKLCKAKGKIKIGESIKREVELQQESGNSARRWINECGLVKVDNPVHDDPRWKPMKDWMKMYQDYCKDYSEMPKSASSVGKIFKDKGFASKRKSDGMWWCIGIVGEDTDNFGNIGSNPYAQMDDKDLPF